MSNQNPQDQLVNFAMKELTKILQDVKNGKMAEMSTAMEKISSALDAVNQQQKPMNDEEMKKWAEQIVKEVPNLEDE